MMTQRKVLIIGNGNRSVPRATIGRKIQDDPEGVLTEQSDGLDDEALKAFREWKRKCESGIDPE